MFVANLDGLSVRSLAEACRMKLQKMEGGIHGIDLVVTAHAEKEDAETLIEPDIGGRLDSFRWILRFLRMGTQGFLDDFVYFIVLTVVYVIYVFLHFLFAQTEIYTLGTPQYFRLNNPIPQILNTT